MIHRVFLGLGSNLGDRLVNLSRAIHLLEPEVHLLRVSSIYETQPWGVREQPDFLNCVILGTTNLSPQELLIKLKTIEMTLGRKPSYRYGPRLIDLDILFYDHLVIETGELIIPHPRISERPFVLIPLAEVAGRMTHPVTGQSIKSLAKACAQESVRLYTRDLKDISNEQPA